ncbi:UDP-N-acetylmuramate dehydrogenase [Tamlana fucoidanivorans]|uniref:UDP-N-acetylenolpyruvoylglucosamine reductase n=1 Tax=Allotamlana fucoidanivorans TaxID=2583814 RepID=A0A5C4SMY9_9FLAO|nr:UDP-N-acetylmuramate dehydrogenase [Tamlana fucoidanivorans]TNJ44595.1 UDP-N-acetylmuramate dehydrogenase [Tamlana fucoidanivorans]
MEIKTNISLKPFNTFGIDAHAKYFATANTLTELKTYVTAQEYPNKLILGGGSNILLTKDYDGLVILNRLKGIELVNQNDDFVFVNAQAGENWHEFVLWCIANHYGGVENLSLIPGNVGTAPIQNIGAYGVELKDVFHSCEALEIKTGKLNQFTNTHCNFGYRNSIFKNEAKGQFIITSVTFKLTRQHHKLSINYGTIISELEKQGIQNPNIKDVSNAVISIRKSKLPDPKFIGNSGSFFKNPVIERTHFDKLANNFSDIPSYPVSDNLVKVPAGWLIEKAGFKGKQFNNYGVHKNQALVLVNYGGAQGSDILKLALLIQKTVKRLFNIIIEPEVNII